MARDLLTPDEIKQLHYKIIIFPIVGYPIFRDTVLYTKFSCYRAGCIDRKVDSLKDLFYTYFTVEDLKSDKNKKVLCKDEEKEEMLEVKRMYEEGMFCEAKETLEKILYEKITSIEYNSINNRLFMKIITSGYDNNDLLKIRSKLDYNKYHIINEQDGIIEIHLKNLSHI